MSADDDRRARAEALDPARSFIVQAPAGSGKTELLTQRVLLLLARVEAPECILALTFTRKAAAEMRHRIVSALSRAADPTPPEAEHARHTWTLARAARANAEARGWALDETPQRLQINTLDAWCGALVRRSPLLSEAGGVLRIAEHPASLYREAARRTLDMLDTPGPTADALRTVLLHLDHRSDRLLQFLVALLAGRDRWRGLIGVIGPGSDMRTQSEALIGKLVDTMADEALTRLPLPLREQWWRSAQYAVGHLPPDHALRGATALPGLPARAIEAPLWRPLVDLLLTAQGELRKTVNKNTGFPTAKDGGDDAAKAAHVGLLAELGRIDGAAAALALLARLPAPRYEDSQWELLDALLRVLGHAMAELQLLFSNTGGVDHVEVSLRALQALGNEAAPTDLLLKLDQRLEHILVDEFQDTSDSQMQLLRMLTLDWSPDDGRTLFLVGDPMQSIYRFRNANVGLFLRAREHGIGALHPVPLRLERNFRSQAGIVDWVNRVFPAVLPDEDPQRGAVRYAPSVAHHPPEDEAVRWHMLGAEEEAARIADICSAVPAHETVAILVRSRRHLDHVVPALRAAGLRFRAVDVEGLAERPAIDDLRAITRALSQPADRIAWLALLRAPWCGLTLTDLGHLSAGLKTGEPLWPRLLAEPTVPELGTGARTRLARLRPLIADAMRERGRVPLHTRVERLWLALGGAACLESAADAVDATAFLELLAKLSEGGAWVDLAALDHGLSELRAGADPEADGRIQLMTMHKAKGLQFSHVILPGLGRASGSGRAPVIVYSTALDERDHEMPLLAPIHAAEADSDPLFAFLDKQVERVRDEAEAARLLYVAVTRAERRLHLFADITRGADGEPRPGRGLLRHLWPGVAAELSASLPPAVEAGEPENPPDQPPTPDPRLRRLPLDWRMTPPTDPLPIPIPEAVTADEDRQEVLFDWAGETARIGGVLYHRWVQYLAGQPLDEWHHDRIEGLRDWLVDAASREGFSASRAVRVAELVIAALRETLDDPRGRWLLSTHAGGHWSEMALQTLDGDRPRRHIIDRCFIDEEGRRWIVDYKTSRHEGGDLAGFVSRETERYAPQLRRYAALLGGDGREQRLALYYPLLPAGERFVEIEN